VKTGLSRFISVLDRDDLCPDIPGINKIPSPLKTWRNLGWNRYRLQQLCDETLTEVFLTAGEVTPAETLSVRVETDIGNGILQIFSQDHKSKRLALPRGMPPLPCNMGGVLSWQPPDSIVSEGLQNEPTLAQFAMALHEEISFVFHTSIAIHSRRGWHKRSFSQHSLMKWRRGLAKLKQQFFGVFKSRVLFVAP